MAYEPMIKSVVDLNMYGRHPNMGQGVCTEIMDSNEIIPSVSGSLLPIKVLLALADSRFFLKNQL